MHEKMSLVFSKPTIAVELFVCGREGSQRAGAVLSSVFGAQSLCLLEAILACEFRKLQRYTLVDY